MPWKPTHSTVWSEGCDLNYWHAGVGQMIFFVPGGNGHGRQFHPIMEELCDKYTVATYDRRQMSGSQVQVNKKLDPHQQARDIRTVIRATSRQTVVLFGSSSGGIFALQFAQEYPEMVDCLIVHEAPLTALLPDAASFYAWFVHLLEVKEHAGWEKAQAEFAAELTGYDDEGVPPTVSPEQGNVVNFWEHEAASLMGYLPNLWRIKENGTRVGVMRAVRSKDAFFARATDELAKVLDCLHAVVPGHHQGFEVEIEAFLPHLVDMMAKLQEGKEYIPQRW